MAFKFTDRTLAHRGNDLGMDSVVSSAIPSIRVAATHLVNSWQNAAAGNRSTEHRALLCFFEANSANASIIPDGINQPFRELYDRGTVLIANGNKGLQQSQPQILIA
jgi:hypothetical protein